MSVRLYEKVELMTVRKDQCSFTFQYKVLRTKNSTDFVG